MRIAVCIEGGAGTPADRAALEVGMGIRERLVGVRLEAFSVCEEAHAEALFFARARGADTEHRIAPAPGWRDHCSTALALAARLHAGEPFDLLLCGERSREPEARIGPLVAELLELRTATGVCGVRERRRDGLVVERRIAGGGPLPARVLLPVLLTTTEDAAATFRMPPQRLERARQQPIDVWELAWPPELPRQARRSEQRRPEGSQMRDGAQPPGAGPAPDADR